MSDNETIDLPEPVQVGVNLRDDRGAPDPVPTLLERMTDKKLVQQLHHHRRWFDAICGELAQRNYLVLHRRRGGHHEDGSARSHGGVGDIVAVVPPREMLAAGAHPPSPVT